MKIEVEIAMIHVSAEECEECQQLSGAWRKAWSRFSLGSEGINSANTLIPDFWPPEL